MSFDILHRVVHSELCSQTREYERAAMVDELFVPFAIEGTKYTYPLGRAVPFAIEGPLGGAVPSLGTGRLHIYMQVSVRDGQEGFIDPSLTDSYRLGFAW